MPSAASRAGSASRSISRSWAAELEGAPPPVDLADEIKAGRLIRALIREKRVSAVHDISDGGLLVAVAEMALAGGEWQGIGVELFPYEGKLPAHAIWFGEDQGRYVVAVDPRGAEEVLERARLLALPARIVGRSGGDTSRCAASRCCRSTSFARRTSGGCRATWAQASRPEAAALIAYCARAQVPSLFANFAMLMRGRNLRAWAHVLTDRKPRNAAANEHPADRRGTSY